jgi:protein-tyrosine-phosphatase
LHDGRIGSQLVALNLLALCTGNAARSVMLGYMLKTLSDESGEDWAIRTAGTLVSEGHAMSGRTRDALLRIPELGHHRVNAHRSHPLSADDVEWSDVILAMEASHVLFVRNRFPDAVPKTVVFGQYLREAPLNAAVVEQVNLVASFDPDPIYDVGDPAGGDQDIYDACADQLWEMAQIFLTLVESP